MLLTAAFASKGERHRPQACKGYCHRLRPDAGRSRCAFVGSRANAYPDAHSDADASPVPYTRPQPELDIHQFRSVSRRDRGQSRQQFPGAARKPGVVRVRARFADQSGRRRRVGSHRRAAVSDLGRGLWNFGHAPARRLDFVGDRRQTWGGVAGLGATVAPGVNLGVSVDQSRTSIDVPLALQSATLDLTQFGFNASVDKGPWTWAVALVHGFGKINSSRDTGFGIASAGYNAQIDGALTELSYYWNIDQSRIVPKAALEYVRATTGSFQEAGGLDPLTATGATVERSRILLGAEVGHYWISDQKIFDLSAYGKFVDNTSQNFSSIIVSLGAESISVQGIGESRYGADAGASASLSLSNTARLYLNYDAKFRAALQSHQGTLGVELKW